MCFPDKKMYIYTATGILVDRILYRGLADECGKPVSISENGKYLLFRESEHNPEVHLIEVTLTGLNKIKTVNVGSEINKYVASLEESKNTHQIRHFIEVYMDSLNNFKLISVSFSLNDCGDILARMKPTFKHIKHVITQKKNVALFDQDHESDDDDDKKDTYEQSSMFFYMSNEQKNEHG